MTQRFGEGVPVRRVSEVPCGWSRAQIARSLGLSTAPNVVEIPAVDHILKTVVGIHAIVLAVLSVPSGRPKARSHVNKVLFLWRKQVKRNNSRPQRWAIRTAGGMLLAGIGLFFLLF